jgi:hypothetical protein
VVDETMHLRNRKVSILRTGGDLVYVSAGLDEGDRVSLTALDSAFAGAQVKILSTTPSNLLDQQGRPGAGHAAELSASSSVLQAGADPLADEG